MRDCSCIRGVFNVHAEALDKDTLVVTDVSEWMDEEGYDPPTVYTASITPPASSRAFDVLIDANKTNKITSEDIGAIKDGVYCFTVESCGKVYTRNKALFPKMECCVAKAWATMPGHREDQIREVDKFLMLATHAAELGNVNDSFNNLKIARQLLDNLKCDCDC